MTHRELARQLKISPASLSLIINNKPGISDATRERIKSQLSNMGYADLIRNPEVVADNATAPLSKGEIGFVIYKRHGAVLNQHPFFMLLMESIENRASKYGYNVLLITIDHADYPKEQIKALDRKGISGAILFATEMLSEDLTNFETLQIPYIALDNFFERIPVNTVAIDNEMGTYQAISYLVSKGHRKIGYLQSDISISSFDERSSGYRDALHAFGIIPDPNFTFRVPYSEEESYLAMHNILSRKPLLPTAFVCDDDTIAIGAMRAFKEAGISVPNDISIIGFNDRPSCEMVKPPLTSVNVPRSSFGAEAVDALVKQMDRISRQSLMARSLKLRVGTQLIERSSVKDLNNSISTGS